MGFAAEYPKQKTRPPSNVHLIVSTLIRRLAFAVGLICALAASQLPEFAQQYRQRLGGAIDELDRMIAQFDAEADAQSLTRAQGVERLKTNSDTLAQERGAAIETDLDRVARLARQRETFKVGGPLTRLAALIENFDAATASMAMRDYEPAIPVTAEAFVVGGIALVIGWGAMHLLAWPISRRLRRPGVIRTPEPSLEPWETDNRRSAGG
jgi:Protein of unknown function (DUF2937)